MQDEEQQSRHLGLATLLPLEKGEITLHNAI